MDKTNLNRRDQAAYGLTEAARYLKLPPATLRSWVVGRSYPRGEQTAKFFPLIKPAALKPTWLSFYNLIEAHVLRSLRTDHGVAISELRHAIDFAERKLNINRLLLSRDLRTHAGQVFLEEYGKLTNLSASGQLAMRRMFDEHLARVEWDDLKFPIRLFPYSASTKNAQRSIVIDPDISFGRPMLASASISTSAIVERIDAGEAVSDVAEDYDVSIEEVEDAVMYERAA